MRIIQHYDRRISFDCLLYLFYIVVRFVYILVLKGGCGCILKVRLLHETVKTFDDGYQGQIGRPVVG
jgi:hypothetical protein